LFFLFHVFRKLANTYQTCVYMLLLLMVMVPMNQFYRTFVNVLQEILKIKFLQVNVYTFSVCAFFYVVFLQV